MKILITLAVVCLCFLSIYGWSDYVNIREVRNITFYRNRWTTNRLNQPRPQVSCSPNIWNCPNTVNCTNPNQDPIWKCQAVIPAGYRMVQTPVSCESYGFPGQPNIVINGSCFVTVVLQRV